MLSLALLALLEAAPRQPLLAYWVSHHDVPPPTLAPWSEQSELPHFVLYDDGLVLVSRGGVVETTTLTPAASKPFTEGQDAFFELPDSISATNRMHPPVHLVTRWRNGTRKTVRFFGALTEAEERAKAPPLLQALLERLTTFQPKVTAWAPEQLVVRTCKTTAKPEGKRWPAGWQKPEQGSAVTFLDGCFEHRLPAAERKTAEALAAKGKNLFVIAEGTQVWLVTLVRFALPAEEAWAGR